VVVPLSSLPNLITLGRLILVPMIISAIADGRWTLTFAGFLLAGTSDAVDGFLARRYGWKSRLGAYLDPVADKALLVSIYIALALADVVPATLAIVVVSRDVMIVGGVIICWLIDKPLEIRPLLVSKLNTTAQIAFAAAVLGGMAFGVSFGLWFDISLLVVATLTLGSAAAYLLQWLDHVTD
jgi:cardiolipin synthase (CMP-forming)